MTIELTPKQFLENELKKTCEGLGRSGCPSLVVGMLPNQQIVCIQSNHQAGTTEYADELKELGRRILAHAEQSVPLFKSTLILPQ